MQSSNRVNMNSQQQQPQARNAGTGNADQARYEWARNISRDVNASYISHHPMLAYIAIAENESIGRVRFDFQQRMLLPCGPPPEKDEDISN